MTVQISGIVVPIDSELFTLQRRQIEPLVPGLPTLRGRKLCEALLDACTSSTPLTKELETGNYDGVPLAQLASMSRLSHQDRNRLWARVHGNIVSAFALALQLSPAEAARQFHLDKITLDGLDEAEKNRMLQIKGIRGSAREGYFVFTPITA